MAIRTAFAAGSLCPLGVVLFVEHFVAGRIIHKRRILILAGFAVVLSLFSFSPWMVTRAVREPHGMQPLYGALHPVMAAYTLFSFGLAAATLAKHYRRLVGVPKIQARHVFLAFIVPGILAATTNVLVPLAAGTSAYNGLGPIFSLLMIVMVAHAIIRHRFMDIRVVVRHGVVYLGTLLTSAGLVAVVILGSNVLLPQGHEFSLREVLFVLIVVLVFQSVKSQVQRVFDLYLYREPYDYPRTLKEASRDLTN
jgi:hypothetical protein